MALGGDGFMLQTLHEYMNSETPVYGMNRGSVGFLMNEYATSGLLERLAAADMNELRPLRMTTRNADGTSSIAPLLAITPVSAFRPRRWRGALLPNTAVVDIAVLEPEKRIVNAFADHTEVKHVLHVRIEQDPVARAKVLSDPNRSWSERILAEQFSD